jgi:hypothetical protein
MLYDVHIPRCAHIKTNGTQCGSPALRERRYCFFHKKWQGQHIALNAPASSPLGFTMPVLEDADSIQVALMQVMRLILAGQLDPKAAGLLLYALQTASFNLRRMTLAPFRHETVVIDPSTVANNSLEQNPWSEEQFRRREQLRRAAQAKQQVEAKQAEPKQAQARQAEAKQAEANKPEIALPSSTSGDDQLKKPPQSEKPSVASQGQPNMGHPGMGHPSSPQPSPGHPAVPKIIGMSRDSSPAERIQLLKAILQSG